MKSVLIVDDDANMRRLVGLTLRVAGFNVETAVDGLDALEHLDNFSPDAIVLDLMMPRMDGREFYRHLRDRGMTTPVLILSAFGSDPARCALQAEASLPKPFEPETLVETVAGLVSN